MIKHKHRRGRRLNLNENGNNDHDGGGVKWWAFSMQEEPVKKRKEMIKEW